MFENLIAQPVSLQLIDDITNDRLPPSILFSGESASGKLTAALELARILSCHEGEARWTCSCSSCARHKELSHPDLLIMGPRDCILEIRAAAQAMLRKPAVATRFLFLRSIRKLIIRFNPVLQDSGDPKYSKTAPLLAELDERLEELAPSRPLPDDPAALEKIVLAIVGAAEKLEDDFLYDSIPVQQVRNAASWARLTPSGKKKVLIIENADRMQDSARNAFLKVLEEPPSDAMFILTTTRRSAIMPTILSRVRTYTFVERPKDAQEEVIARVFHDTPVAGELLPGYFNRFLPVSPEATGEAARLFLSMVLVSAIDEGRRPVEGIRTVLGGGTAEASVQSILAILNKCKPEIVYRHFLTRIARYMREALRTGLVDARESAVYARWTERIREALDSVEIYNIGPQAALERLLQEMKSAL